MILPLEYDITYKINQDENKAKDENQAKDENLNSQDKALTQAPSKESNMALTGIPYLDEKIKNKTLSAYDAYLANRYMGVNFANLNIQANLKHTNLTQTTKDLGIMLNALQNSEEVLKRSDLAGTIQGLESWLNQKTSGFYGLDDERAKLQAAGLQTAYAAADAMNNGKATNESRKEARETFGVGFRDQKELVARTAQAREAMLNRIDTLLDDLEAKGGSLGLDKTMLTKINEQKRKQEFLNNTMYEKYGGKFDYKAYQSSIYEDYYKSKKANQTQQDKTFTRLKK